MDSGNDLFIRYLSEAIGAGKAKVALSALGEPASVSVRMNPCKLPASGHFQGKVSGVPWSEYGLMLEDRPVFTLDPLLHAGCYYVQDSSSMFVGHVLRKILPEVYADGPLRVLDLCAAPGGKTTDAAASLRSVLGDGFLLVSNEVIRSRASVLAANVALWGDPSVMVTSADPAVIGRNEGFFDIILADVPCSGEGMFRKDADSAAQWSEENVEHCVARQRRILADVFQADIETISVTNSAGLGAALRAAGAVEGIPLEKLWKSFCRAEETVKPNPDNRRLYDSMMEHFREFLRASLEK